MRHGAAYKFLIIILCSCMAVMYACTGMNAAQCPLKAYASSKCQCCCGGCGSHVWPGISEISDPPQDNDDASGPLRSDCRDKSCCQACSSLAFLTTNHSFSFLLADSSALDELNLPLPVWAFDAQFFRPPRS